MEKPIMECKDRIRMGLERKNMSQSELAKRTGLTKSAISEYLSGRYKPTQLPTYLISKALDVSEAWLMGFDVPMERIEYMEVHITHDEKCILDKYKSLSDESKKQLTNYLDFLSSRN